MVSYPRSEFMHRHRRFFYWMGLFCLAAAAWLCLRTRDDVTRSNATGPSANTPTAASRSPSRALAPRTGGGGQPAPGQPAVAALTMGGTARAGAAAPNASPSAAGPPKPFPFRLSNTDQSLSQLGRSDTAILLENALIDTANP